MRMGEYDAASNRRSVLFLLKSEDSGTEDEECGAEEKMESEYDVED